MATVATTSNNGQAAEPRSSPKPRGSPTFRSMDDSTDRDHTDCCAHVFKVIGRIGHPR